MNSEAGPKSLASEELSNQRLGRIHEPHVEPLNRFVEALRTTKGPSAQIPYFDPSDGGREAEVLFLLEAPGPRALNSGFVSRDNPDETAKNLFELTNEAGIDRKRVVAWNIVPWYIGNDERTKIRPAKNSDIDEALGALTSVLSLLPKLRAVVLFGRKAQKAEQYLNRIDPNLEIFRCPHPSPLVVNRSDRNRSAIREVLVSTRKLIDNNPSLG